MEDRGMKRRRKKLMIIIPVTCVCVAGTFGYFKLAHTKPVMQETKIAQSAEAKKGNLSKTIVGTGNLELAWVQGTPKVFVIAGNGTCRRNDQYSTV